MARVSKEHIDLFYSHHIDLSSKTLYLGYGEEGNDHELDPKLASDMIKGLHILNRVRPEEKITILINCQGGDVDQGLAIMDKIEGCQCHVVGVVIGVAWSMAAWVLQACDERLMTARSSLMIHDGQGPKDKFTKMQDRMCRDIILTRMREKDPTFSLGRLQKMLDTDSYLKPDEALSLGLIDGVL